jgi:hypothetical protein
MDIEDFKDKHLGEECALLCNGPSLSRYNLRNIDITLFGVNRSWVDPSRDYPHSHGIPTKYHYASDIVHAAEFDKGLFDCEYFFHRYIDVLQAVGDVKDRVDQFVDIGLLYREWGLKYAGPTALKLAFYLGFTTIWLLGVDLIDGGKKFYETDPVHKDLSTGYARQRKRMRKIADELPIDVVVYNCNPATGIDCFPIKERRDWLYA